MSTAGKSECSNSALNIKEITRSSGEISSLSHYEEIWEWREGERDNLEEKKAKLSYRTQGKHSYAH